jgi:hypothetical protein
MSKGGGSQKGGEETKPKRSRLLRAFWRKAADGPRPVSSQGLARGSSSPAFVYAGGE